MIFIMLEVAKSTWTFSITGYHDSNNIPLSNLTAKCITAGKKLVAEATNGRCGSPYKY